MKERSDQELVRGCLRGEEGCFDELVDRYEKPLYNMAYRVSGSTDDAEDITQSAFIKVYENLRTFDPHRKFFSWLYRIALNEALNFKRSQRETSDAVDTIPSEDHGIHQDLEEQEERERIGRALFGLQEDLRAVIVLHYFSGCSYNDISYIMSIPERTVKSRLYEAREKLRRLLRPRQQQ